MSDKWFPNFTPNSYLGVQTPKQGIPKLGVNFFIESAPDPQKSLFFVELKLALDALTIIDIAQLGVVRCTKISQRKPKCKYFNKLPHRKYQPAKFDV